MAFVSLLISADVIFMKRLQPPITQRILHKSITIILQRQSSSSWVSSRTWLLTKGSLLSNRQLLFVVFWYLHYYAAFSQRELAIFELIVSYLFLGRISACITIIAFCVIWSSLQTLKWENCWDLRSRERVVRIFRIF